MAGWCTIIPTKTDIGEKNSIEKERFPDKWVIERCFGWLLPSLNEEYPKLDDTCQ
jgi:hypothetical protein